MADECSGIWKHGGRWCLVAVIWMERRAPQRATSFVVRARRRRRRRRRRCRYRWKHYFCKGDKTDPCTRAYPFD